ncbi:ABC transporter substrate-binding protein [Actinomadura sp. 7K534]|uniref:ABC transporter substrate-binding protein n=1 Tax=Actinomadura sp. 7K534 TaxID=2530366 RepID=UPI00104BF42F|nr:ABC transporter substrate-binding protein [Actinomadura sp. 7K534]TDB93978.1 transporter substrate-binding domain-containing protein [Actinomadura sp. 7K534]
MTRRSPSSRLRALAAGLTGLAIGLAATGCGGGAEAEDGVTVLRVGTTKTFGWVPTFPAHGDDKSGKVRIEVVDLIGGSNAMIAALKADRIDVAELGEVGPVVAQAGDVPFKIITATTPWPKGQGIIVDEKSPIKSLSDLKGKKISYVRGTNSHWTLNRALDSAGLTMEDVELVQLPDGTNAQQVLRSGNLDAATVIDPTLTTFLSSGSRLLTDGTTINADNPLFYIASDKALGAKKEAVGEFVAQLARHIAWAKAEPEERSAAVAKLNGIPAEIALKAERNRPAGLHPIEDATIRGNQRIADLFFQQGVIKKKITVDSVFTTEFNSRARP